MKVYKSLSNPIDKATELEISVGYEKGGINYFSGEVNKRGAYVYVIPVSRGNGTIRRVLLGDIHTAGFKVLVKEMGRKNQKIISDIETHLTDDILSEIVNSYENYNYNKVRSIILSLI